MYTLSSSPTTLSQHLTNSLIWFILSGSEILFVVKSEPWLHLWGVPKQEGSSSGCWQATSPATVHSCKGVSLTFALQPHLILRISPGKQLPGAPSRWLHHIALQGSYCCPLLAAGMGFMQGAPEWCSSLAQLHTTHLLSAPGYSEVSSHLSSPGTPQSHAP